MPASLTLCPRCGGVVDAPVGAPLGGKSRCSCAALHGGKKKRAASSGAGGASTVATMPAPPALGIGANAASEYTNQLTAAGKQKFCCVCGKDITHDRRMKDTASGRYWCTECGANQPQHVQHAMDMPCPECQRRVAAVRLIRFEERYVCPACYARHNQRGFTGGRLPVLFILGLVLTGVILYGLFVLGLH